MSSFFRDLWTSYNKIYGPILTVAAFLLPFLVDFKTALTINRFWPVYAVCLLIVLLTLIDMLLAARARATALALAAATAAANPHIQLPKALGSYPHHEQNGKSPLVIVLEPSSLFGYNAAVSIYYNDDWRGQKLERLIGFGRVSNIETTNLRIQVLVIWQLDQQAPVWTDIRENKDTVLQSLIVKPSVPHDAISGGYLNG